MAKTITSANFESEVLKSDKPVLLDFWATWCGPCKMIAPIVEELSNEATDYIVGKVNVDEEMELSQKYGISAIPTLKVFAGGECKATAVGYQSKEQILALIESAK